MHLRKKKECIMVKLVLPHEGCAVMCFFLYFMVHDLEFLAWLHNVKHLWKKFLSKLIIK